MNKIKVIATAVLATITSMLGVLSVPVFLLIIFNIIDYITGIAAAKNRGMKISSYVGFHGIVKKVSMYLLIIVAAGIDELIIHVGLNVGLKSPFHFAIACIVSIWLVLNEALSITENMVDIGVPMPPFLIPLIKNLKTKVEEAAEEEEDAPSEEKKEE